MAKIKRGLYILMFLLLIALPVVVYPYLGEKVDKENFEKRALAQRPEFTLDNYTSFPEKFEAYFNDSLPFRNRLIGLNTKIDLSLGISPLPHVLIGSDGFLFYHPNGSDGDPIGDYMGATSYTEREIKLIAHRLLRAQYDLEKEGRAFAALIAPNKETIYAEKYLPGVQKVSDVSRADKVYAYLKEKTDLNIVYPKDDLNAVMAAHPDWYTYYKTDTHWNSIGAYVGTSLVMEKLGLPINDIDSVRVIEKERAPGDLVYMLGMTESFPNDADYNIVDVPAAIKQDKSFGDGENMVRYTNSEGNGKTLLVVRDSFAVFMMPYFNMHFSECYYIHKSAYHPSMIQEYDPDCVVFETVERYLGDAMNFYAK